MLVAALAPALASAQQHPADDPGAALLRELIPDAALARPDDWAKAPPAAIAPVLPDPLRAGSPLADWADLALAWPDPAQSPPVMPAVPATPDPAATPGPAAVELAAAPPPAPDGIVPLAKSGGRLTLTFPPPALFPLRSTFEARFRPLSALLALSGKEADTIGQIAVRAASDRDTLLQLLRLYGYYDGEVVQTLAGLPGAGAGTTNAAISVAMAVLPGARYRFGAIDLGDLARAGADAAPLRQRFALQPGDPLDNDAVLVNRAALETALGESGYPFATLGDPQLLIDHRAETGDLTLPVSPAGKYRLGTLNSTQPRFLSSNHLADIARFKPGQLYQRSKIDDLRRAILATGLVASATVTAREVRAPAGDVPGEVALDVTMARAPLRTIAGALGYDTGEGFRLEASWENRNLLPPEGLLRLRAVAGTDEQLGGITLRRNNFLGRDRALTIDVYADNATLTAYAARKVAFATTFERQTTLLFQKPWVWSMGLEVEASAEREGVPSGITTGRTNYLTLALPLRTAFDFSDSLLDPHRGWRLAGRVSPEGAFSRGAWSAYTKLQVDGSAYLPAGKTVVLAARVRLGSILGVPLNDVAPSRRFYAGGGGSVRGYGYQLVGPRNGAGDITGGRSLYEASIEARIKTPLFGGALSLAPFLDAGGVDTGTAPAFHDTRYGAGLGLRYQSGFGPIRIDLGTPLGRRPGESVIGVTVALGQSF